MAISLACAGHALLIIGRRRPWVPDRRFRRYGVARAGYSQVPLAQATPSGRAPAQPIAIELRISNRASVGAGRRILIAGLRRAVCAGPSGSDESSCSMAGRASVAAGRATSDSTHLESHQALPAHDVLDRFDFRSLRPWVIVGNRPRTAPLGRATSISRFGRRQQYVMPKLYCRARRWRPARPPLLRPHSHPRLQRSC